MVSFVLVNGKYHAPNAEKGQAHKVGEVDASYLLRVGRVFFCAMEPVAPIHGWVRDIPHLDLAV